MWEVFFIIGLTNYSECAIIRLYGGIRMWYFTKISEVSKYFKATSATSKLHTYEIKDMNTKEVKVLDFDSLFAYDIYGFFYSQDYECWYCIIPSAKELGCLGVVVGIELLSDHPSIARSWAVKNRAQRIYHSATAIDFREFPLEYIWLGAGYVAQFNTGDVVDVMEMLVKASRFLESNDLWSYRVIYLPCYTDSSMSEKEVIRITVNPLLFQSALTKRIVRG